MKQLILKKAIFYPTEIVIIKKKGNVTISVDDIEYISYNKPKMSDYFTAFLFPGGTTPKFFQIRLKKEVGGKKWFGFSVEPKDVEILQEFFQKEIFFN